MSTSLRLFALFSDHLVLQRGVPNPLWGWDRPGQRVRLSVEGTGVALALETTAGADGSFRLEIPVLDVAGPYHFQVTGSGTVHVSDVWFGEVWLASGQSNMEWPLAATDDADREIERADLPLLRTFKVTRTAALTPEPDVVGQWSVCSPETATAFSAVGYYFAKELHRELAVPCAIIDATWGGTTIEAWTSLDAVAGADPSVLARVAEFNEGQTRLASLKQEYEATLGAWERGAFPREPENTGVVEGWARADHDDSAWQTLALPAFWQDHGMAFNGVVWFRREVMVPEAWAGRSLQLNLGAIDDFDQTYFNGELVGAHPDGTVGAFQMQRSYEVPAHCVRAGRNVIAVRVFDHFGQGGFAGPSRAMTLRLQGVDVLPPAASLLDAPPGNIAPPEVLPLHGPWRFQVEHALPLVPASIYATYPAPPLALAKEHCPGALFNGMIAPLGAVRLRGVLWYQGESNTERHALYRTHTLAWVRDWRRHFADNALPFLWVQLANYGADDSWPKLRAAQAAALSEAHTYMVTAVDIGNSTDIHPRNKREVGRRLALVARANVYHEAGVLCAGPLATRARRVESSGSQVHVQFEHAAELHTRDQKEPREFTLAGEDGLFFVARAQLVRDGVLLDADAVKHPVVARYAFSDDPQVNLVNGADLPALPFELVVSELAAS